MEAEAFPEEEGTSPRSGYLDSAPDLASQPAQGKDTLEREPLTQSRDGAEVTAVA